MKKVLFFANNLGSGGSEKQMVTLAKLFKEEGIYVEFLCISNGDFFKKELEDNNININWLQIYDNRLLNFLKLSFFKGIFVVNNFLRKKNYDVVISFLPYPNILNNIHIIGRKKWKVIVGERSSKHSTFTSKRGRIFAWFYRYADLIVCNSNNAKNMWLENYPQYRNKLNTIYNNVTLQLITSNYIPKKDDKLHIIIAASYQYLKNPIGLIKALSLINEEQRKKIEIYWYGRIEVSKGDTRAYNEAVSLINENNLQEVIHLNEETKDIANKMNEADVVALFSSVEGLPNAICEGMMIGKPIIMSRVSDFSVLVDDSNGFLCDWDNIESIKEALVSAMNLTSDQIMEMGNNSKIKAEELFSVKVILYKWVNNINN